MVFGQIYDNMILLFGVLFYSFILTLYFTTYTIIKNTVVDLYHIATTYFSLFIKTNPVIICQAVTTFLYKSIKLTMMISFRFLRL